MSRGRAVAVQFDVNVVVVILRVPSKDDAALGLAEPLPVSEDNPLDLIDLAIVYAPVEKPVAPPLAVRIGVVQENVHCPPFKMYVRLSFAGVGIDAAAGTGEIAGLLGPLPGRRDADDFVDKDENAGRWAAGVMLARGISLCSRHLDVLCHRQVCRERKRPSMPWATLPFYLLA